MCLLFEADDWALGTCLCHGTVSASPAGRLCYCLEGQAPVGELRVDCVQWQIGLTCAGSETSLPIIGPASSGTPLLLHLARYGLISNLQKLAAGLACHTSQQGAASSSPASSAAMDIDSCSQQSNSSNGPSPVDRAFPADAVDDTHVSSHQHGSIDPERRPKSSNGSQQGATATGTPLLQGRPSICEQLVRGLMRSYLCAYRQQPDAQRRACVQEMLHILCQPFLHQRYACS